MAQTTDSATIPYCTSRQMLLCYGPSIVADFLKSSSNNPPPSFLAMIDPANPAGQKLRYHLGVGAGEIESVCAIGRRYTPEDLQALLGVSQIFLQKLNAARGMWSLAQTTRPLTARPDEVPMAKESAQLLMELRDGIKIFTFEETEDAGLPSVVPPNPAQLLTGNVVGRAYRLFPNSPLGNSARRNWSE